MKDGFFFSFFLGRRVEKRCPFSARDPGVENGRIGQDETRHVTDQNLSVDICLIANAP